MVEVLTGGLLTTVQDLGRFGYSHLGISAAGGLRILFLIRAANRLVGNSEDAATLEMTLKGGVFGFWIRGGLP